MDYAGRIHIDPQSPQPIYRQLADRIAGLIAQGVLRAGAKLPATRELAGVIGLNRTTISAAYAALEEAGLITGHVGRGSFVAEASVATATQFDWDAFLPESDGEETAAPRNFEISFASSRPARGEFPMDQFRHFAKQVLDGEAAAEILQLGSPHGFAPLRRYLLNQAVAEGVAGPEDDLMITNGCQQAFDLLARSTVRRGTGVVIEDPVYHGLLKVFKRAGAELLPVPVDARGMRPEALRRVLEKSQAKLVIVTPSFQNPTGVTLPMDRREEILGMVQRAGSVLVENDIYSELRYAGTALPRMKQMDGTGSTVLLRSYSKIAFPGLRVGWVIGPRPLIARLAEEKQTSDLHSDQLSQAVLLRFAASGELAKHLERTCAAGALRLRAALEACRDFLPRASKWTRPEGGMSLWIELPAPLTAERVLVGAAANGVDFLPGRYFSASATHARELRISFGGLPPAEIRAGLRVIGEIAQAELRGRALEKDEPAAALV